MNKLPIESFKDEILRTVNDNPIVIIEGSTGSGKSTRVPIFLAKEGYKVLITQPKIISAISLARNVAKHYGDDKCGINVGYKTGLQSNFSPDSQILFLTEGSELIRQLSGKEDLENTVLIMDEIHEWSIELDVLLAFAKKLIQNGKKLKLLIMSATLESENLSEFLGNAPIIKIPSNRYHVSFFHKRANDIEEIIYDKVNKSKNVLVFLPGKKEINRLKKRLIEHFKAYGKSVQVLSLYSELPYEEQKLVFYHYQCPKVILSTNLAQTSITINDIDVVIDTGLDKRIELSDGIPQLTVKNISVADCIQRKGRVGRCCNGEYYLCSDFKYEHRNLFSTPEISTLGLDNTLLTLIYFNVDISSLDLFHAPDNNNVKHSIQLLERLGAIDNNGKITETGINMCKFPLDSRSARMLVESKKYGVESDVLICCLLMEFGSICTSPADKKAIFVNSDLIFELELFKSLTDLNVISNHKNYPNININNYKKILSYIKVILPKLGLTSITNSQTDVKKIKKCLISGYHDCLFAFEDGVGYLNSNYSEPRFTYKFSVIKRCKYVIGYPMDFSDGKDTTYKRILFPTEYTLDELLEYNDEADLFSVVYSMKFDEIYKALYYNGIEIVSSSLGSISDLKESEPSAFCEKTEYDSKFKQTYISLYYHDLKISSKVVNN